MSLLLYIFVSGISLVDESTDIEEKCSANIQLTEGVKLAYNLPATSNDVEPVASAETEESEFSLDDLANQLKSL